MGTDARDELFSAPFLGGTEEHLALACACLYDMRSMGSLDFVKVLSAVFRVRTAVLRFEFHQGTGRRFGFGLDFGIDWVAASTIKSVNDWIS